MKTLVAGWFSWELYKATAGDLLARDVACAWLREAGVPYDVAVAPPFTGGVDWRAADPREYSQVVFVCGPIRDIGEPLDEFLRRFALCRLVGLDLTMLDPLEQWNPFDLLWERDSSRTARPDIAFAAPPPSVPVVGVVLIHKQKEYGERGRHRPANDAIRRLVDRREMATVPIDTRLDVNTTGLRTAGEVEALIARADVVLTSRLHGLVLALKNGVPVVAVDPVAGGQKVRRQAEVVGWPVVFNANAVTDADLDQAFDFCLSPEARNLALACRERAVHTIEEVRREFVEAVAARVASPRRAGEQPRLAPGEPALVVNYVR